MSASSAPSPLDLDLLASLEEWKNGPGKNLSIIGASSGIVSIAASALLVWIIFRSRGGMKTTYHRLLLGLSVSDILLSSSYVAFNAAVPRELSYAVWNARGSRASCDAFGFVQALGSYSGLLYMCSLNLYYLAKVRFNKTDSYIAKKLEPWLHFVPTLYGLIMSTILVAKQGMNADINGVCSSAYIYEPPHCDGYEDGDAPEGFGIPCGRGRSMQPILWITGMITVFVVPVTIGGSLWTIYRSVSRAEQRISQYGAGALQIANDVRRRPSDRRAATTDVEGGDNGGRGAFSMLSAVSSRFGGWASATSSHNQDSSQRFSVLSAVSSRFGGRASATTSGNQGSSQSRAVLQKAAAYSLAYFVTWGLWLIVYGFVNLAGAWSDDPPLPQWQIAYRYVWNFFIPLQGLWNFLIYMQPNIIRRKRSSDGNISWFRAFADALWPAVTGGNNSSGRGSSRGTGGNNSAGRGSNRAGSGASGTAAVGNGAARTAAGPRRIGTNPTPNPCQRNTSATGDPTNHQSNFTHAESVGLEVKDAEEEEKREILERELSV